jgi:hypothetical protein
MPSYWVYDMYNATVFLGSLFLKKDQVGSGFIHFSPWVLPKGAQNPTIFDLEPALSSRSE